MRPDIIEGEVFFVTGLTGSGEDTFGLWEALDKRYSDCPFPKISESGYEIRFFDGDKKTAKGRDVHVGFSTEEISKKNKPESFTSLVLPKAVYAVFDVYVAKGYDSENETMTSWLSENEKLYKRQMIDGMSYVVECYTEKFKGGDKPDSVVEIWVPLYRACKSCNVFMTRREDLSENKDYCSNCFERGALRSGVTLSVLTHDIEHLEKIEAKHPGLISTPLLKCIRNWLRFEEDIKLKNIKRLHQVLEDGRDCDFIGTEWEREWLDDGKVCHCAACMAAGRCISDIKLMESEK